MTRNAWRALKLAACLAVALDFLTPGAGLIGGAFDPSIGEAHAAGTLPANTYSYNAAAPTGPASTTLTMMGLGSGGTFTPHYDGVAIITITSWSKNGTAGDGASYQIVYGTGTAPSNAGTYTGTACGAPTEAANSGLASSTNTIIPFSITCIATGLALNTPYWIDLAGAQITGGTVTMGPVNVSASEQ
jgi:hypothetical protein